MSVTSTSISTPSLRFAAQLSPRILVGPYRVAPVLRAETLSSARRAKAVVNQMSRIIPRTLRHGPLRSLGPMFPLLHQAFPVVLSPPCSNTRPPDTLGMCRVSISVHLAQRRCSRCCPVSCGRRFPSELCLPSREEKISLTQVFVRRSEKLRST